MNKRSILFLILFSFIPLNALAETYSYQGKEMNAVYIIGIALLAIRIAVPLLLIVIASIDLVKTMLQNDDKEIKKILVNLLPKIIVAIVIFVLPSFLMLLLKLINQDSNFRVYSTCLLKPSSCSATLLEEPPEIEYNGGKDPVIVTPPKNNNNDNNNNNNKNDYAGVDYSKFKWTYYGQKKGPLMDYYPSNNEKFSAYAIWAPEDVSDLNGKSIGLIIWLHGAGETKGKLAGNYFISSGTIQKVFNDWNSYNLDPVPAIIIAPHSYGSFAYKNNSVSTVYAAIKYATEVYNIDKNRIVLMGHSMGADDTISLGYIMYKEYSQEFSAYVSISPSHYITDKKYSSYNKNEVIDFYKTRKAKGYSENTNCKEWYDWTGKPLILYPGAGHSNTPKMAFTEDLDKNGKSDLVEWLFYQ